MTSTRLPAHVLTLHSSLQRKRKAPRDSSTAAVSAAESTKQMMKKKQFSRKINYDALGDIFKNEEEIKQATGSRRSRKRGHADEASDGTAFFQVTDPDGNTLLFDQHVSKPKR